MLKHRFMLIMQAALTQKQVTIKWKNDDDIDEQDNYTDCYIKDLKIDFTSNRIISINLMSFDEINGSLIDYSDNIFQWNAESLHIDNAVITPREMALCA